MHLKIKQQSALSMAILTVLWVSASSAQAAVGYSFNDAPAGITALQAAIPTLGYFPATAVINNSGTIAGQYTDSNTGASPGFVGSQGINYGNTANGVFVNGINSSGAIVGQYFPGSSSTSSSFYATASAYASTTPTQTIALDNNLHGANSVSTQVVSGITDAGVVVGSDFLNNGIANIFEYNTTSKAFTDLTVSGLSGIADNVTVNGVSSNGTYIVGTYIDASNLTEGFVLNTLTNVFQEIKDANSTGGSTYAAGVNTSGVVVGSFTNGNDNNTAAYTYDATTGTFINDNVVDKNASSGYTAGSAFLTTFTGINDNNTIVGLNSNYTVITATAVSAVPLPSAVWLFGTAMVAGLYGSKRRKSV